MAKAQRSGRRVKKNIPSGIVYIQSTFNNTIVTVMVFRRSKGLQGVS